LEEVYNTLRNHPRLMDALAKNKFSIRTERGNRVLTISDIWLPPGADEGRARTKLLEDITKTLKAHYPD